MDSRTQQLIEHNKIISGMLREFSEPNRDFNIEQMKNLMIAAAIRLDFTSGYLAASVQKRRTSDESTDTVEQ